MMKIAFGEPELGLEVFRGAQTVMQDGARYETPVEGLYLGGAGSHPGGGLTGAPGANSARELLKTRTF